MKNPKNEIRVHPLPQHQHLTNENSTTHSKTLPIQDTFNSTPLKLQTSIKNWSEIENCLKNIDNSYGKIETFSKIPNYIESLNELVRIHAQNKGIVDEYEIQARQEEILYLFRSGKNAEEFFKFFDEMIESFISFMDERKSHGGDAVESETGVTKDSEEISEPLKLQKPQKEAEEELENNLINSKIESAMTNFEEKIKQIESKTKEMGTAMLSITKILNNIQETIKKKWKEININESPIGHGAQLTLPLKRRRYSLVEIPYESRYNEFDSPVYSSDRRSSNSTFYFKDQKFCQGKNVEEMIINLKKRGRVRYLDIWRICDIAVIFNLHELKTILDVNKLDELSKMRPWAEVWKVKDREFSAMAKKSSASYFRNTINCENSLNGITKALTDSYLFYFDLYCIWRKLKLWLKNINSVLDFCITPSYPHRIRSIITDETETEFAALLEKAIPYLTKKQLDRDTNLILYSLTDSDYPGSYLINSKFLIISRTQPIDLLKILNPILPIPSPIDLD